MKYHFSSQLYTILSLWAEIKTLSMWVVTYSYITCPTQLNKLIDISQKFKT